MFFFVCTIYLSEIIMVLNIYIYSSKVALVLGFPQGFPQALVLSVVSSVLDVLGFFLHEFKFSLDSKQPH